MSTEAPPSFTPYRSDLNHPLLSLPRSDGGTDDFTIADACEGVQVFGTIGSGKTSGSADTFASAYLRNGFGGLVLCAKVDERLWWEQLAHKNGRTGDLIVVDPMDGRFRFNFLDYLYKLGPDNGGSTDEIARVFDKALELVEGAGRRKGDYWTRAQLQMLANAIEMVRAGHGGLTLSHIVNLILSAPQSILDTKFDASDIQPDSWPAQSFLYETGLLADAQMADWPEEKKSDFNRAVDYWLSEFPAMDARPRSSIVSGFTSMAAALMRGHLGPLLGTGTNVVPEMTFDGAIIVLDISPMRYGQAGQMVQGLFKYLWQRAVLRRDVSRYDRPVFCHSDESQFFISPDDTMFQTVARSQRGCTLYLTQNISTYYGQMGGEVARAMVDSLLGNFQTKIFHLNGDAVTNSWAADQIGRDWKSIGNYGGQVGAGGQGSASYGASKQLVHDVEPSAFLQLKNGGERNNRIVEAVMLRPGRRFADTGKAYRPIAYVQPERK